MSTLLDEETVILDKLDFDVPCVRSERGKEHAATHSCTCRGCGDVSFVCMDCVEGIDRVLRSSARYFLGCYVCRSCTTTSVASLFILVPL